MWHTKGLRIAVFPRSTIIKGIAGGPTTKLLMALPPWMWDLRFDLVTIPIKLYYYYPRMTTVYYQTGYGTAVARAEPPVICKVQEDKSTFAGAQLGWWG